MNWSALEVVLVPREVVTVTATVPAGSAGEMAVIKVWSYTVTAEAWVLPKATVAPAVNPVPSMVTVVPPAVEPLLGLTDVTVGAPKVSMVASIPVAVPPCATATGFAADGEVSLLYHWVA